MEKWISQGGLNYRQCVVDGTNELLVVPGKVLPTTNMNKRAKNDDDWWHALTEVLERIDERSDILRVDVHRIHLVPALSSMLYCL
jgi:hypothetical protein